MSNDEQQNELADEMRVRQELAEMKNDGGPAYPGQPLGKDGLPMVEYLILTTIYLGQCSVTNKSTRCWRRGNHDPSHHRYGRDGRPHEQRLDATAR